MKPQSALTQRLHFSDPHSLLLSTTVLLSQEKSQSLKRSKLNIVNQEQRVLSNKVSLPLNGGPLDPPFPSESPKDVASCVAVQWLKPFVGTVVGQG